MLELQLVVALDDRSNRLDGLFGRHLPDPQDSCARQASIPLANALNEEAVGVEIKPDRVLPEHHLRMVGGRRFRMTLEEIYAGVLGNRKSSMSVLHRRNDSGELDDDLVMSHRRNSSSELGDRAFELLAGGPVVQIRVCFGQLLENEAQILAPFLGPLWGDFLGLLGVEHARKQQG